MHASRQNVSGLQVPKGYVSLGLPLISFGELDVESPVYYDQSLKQSVPSIFSFLTTDEGSDKTIPVKLTDGETVCTVPNNVQQGSRPVQLSGASVYSGQAFLATVTAISVVFASAL